jgi:branched-chain amino acid transport system permease protein
MDLNGFIQNVLNGLSIGAVYAIFALGYTIVFSILGIINFAHGAVFTLGAYFTYFLLGEVNNGTGILAGFQFPFGLPFALAILGGSLLAGAVGVLIERLAFRPLRARGADPLLALVSSLGVALLIINLVQYFVGAEILSFPSNVYGDWVEKNPSLRFGAGEHPIQIRTVQVVIFAVSMVVLSSLGFIIRHCGPWPRIKRLRACLESRQIALFCSRFSSRAFSAVWPEHWSARASRSQGHTSVSLTASKDWPSSCSVAWARFLERLRAAW